MESTINLNMPAFADERQTALSEWLQTLVELPPFTITPMQGDASFRRYFRINTSNGSFVAMDAPPATENCRPFVAIANALRDHQLNAPHIFAANVEQGFLLLTDFGDQTFLKTLNINNADKLYQSALDALAILQSCESVTGHTIPSFNREFMLKEWAWFKEWVLHKWLGLTLSNESELDTCYEKLIQSAEQQPQVFMHRDFHSANLMVILDSVSDVLNSANAPRPAITNDSTSCGLSAESSHVGILDFQDAFIGPITYDAVSLLRDCYIDWPQEKVEAWVEYYRQQLLHHGVQVTSQKEFLTWFDLMGVQRHLKALLTFARKKVRDQQPQYLVFVPRTLNYLLEVTKRYPELSALHLYLRDQVQPASSRMLACAP